MTAADSLLEYNGSIRRTAATAADAFGKQDSTLSTLCPTSRTHSPAPSPDGPVTRAASSPRTQRALSALAALTLAVVCAFVLAAVPHEAHAATATAKYGALKMSGTQLVSTKTGKAVQLRGVSTHGINWDVGHPYISKAAFKTLRDDAIVICGTPNWSQDVDVASKSPLPYKNVLYAVHFYANTHQSAYRDKVKTARKNGLPLFASEFSITDASGNGSLNKSQGAKWLDMLDSYKISYCA